MSKNSKKDEEEKLKKANAEAAKQYCRKCKREIFPSFNCGCAGGPPEGGGGSDGGGGEEKADIKSEASSKKSEVSGQQIASPSHKRDGMKLEHDVRKPTLTPKATMLLIIADLLSKKLLTIDDNKGLCTLTIKCDPKLLSDLQRKAVKDFVNEIKKELEDFKDKNKLSDKDCLVKTETDKQGNIISLSINIPNSKLYNKFIDQLMAKDLLPTQSMSSQDTQKINKDSAGDKKFNPNPLSTDLKPKNFKE